MNCEAPAEGTGRGFYSRPRAGGWVRGLLGKASYTHPPRWQEAIQIKFAPAVSLPRSRCLYLRIPLLHAACFQETKLQKPLLRPCSAFSRTA